MTDTSQVEIGEIKATAVIPTMEFVMFKYGKDTYRNILERLNPEQQLLFKKRMPASLWINLKDFVDFNRAIIDEIYEGKSFMAEDLGKYSAEYGMSTILKMFIRVGNVNFFVKKATSVFATYYRPARMILKSNEKNGASVQVIGLYDENDIIKHRICGFIRNLVEKSGCKKVDIRTHPEMKPGSFVVNATWE